MNLICQIHRTPLPHSLTCEHGHQFARIQGIPVLLRDDIPVTAGFIAASLDAARNASSDGPLYLRSVGMSDELRAWAADAWLKQPVIDPIASTLLKATSGNAYAHLVASIYEYPIPDIRVPAGTAETARADREL